MEKQKSGFFAAGVCAADATSAVGYPILTSPRPAMGQDGLISMRARRSKWFVEADYPTMWASGRISRSSLVGVPCCS